MVDCRKNDSKEIVLTLVTCAPLGTLGDVSSCKKYIEETVASQPMASTRKIRFNLVITDVNDNATKKRIQALLGNNPSYTLMYAKNKDHSFFNNPALNESSAFIFYPSFQIISTPHIQAIKHLNKPTLIVNHYNFDSSTDRRYAAKKEQWIPALYTGFGPTSLGVNIKDLGIKSPIVDIPKEDVDLYNLVFDTESSFTLTQETAQHYSKRKSLFFGYMNKMGRSVSRRNLANPTKFAKACITKSQRLSPGKEVDIIVRLNDKLSSLIDLNFYTQLEKYFRKKNAGLTVALYKKDAHGKLILKNTFGNGNTRVRIIDPFPINNKTMLHMMQISDPFCMITGSESFIESLSCNKLPLYQIMYWHDRLYDELLQEITSIENLGTTSLLYQFFALQDKRKGTTYEQLGGFLCQHELELMKQLQIFKEHLIQNKQLRTRLHNRIVELASSSEEYIRQCLDVDHIIDFNDEPELTAKIANLPYSIIHLYQMFPQNRELICQNSVRLLSAIINQDEKKAAKKILNFAKGCKQFKKEEYNLLADILNGVRADAKKNMKNLIVDAASSMEKTPTLTYPRWLKKPFAIIGSLLFDPIRVRVSTFMIFVSSVISMVGAVNFGVKRKYMNKISRMNNQPNFSDTHAYVTGLGYKSHQEKSDSSYGTSNKNRKKEDNQGSSQSNLSIFKKSNEIKGEKIKRATNQILTIKSKL